MKKDEWILTTELRRLNKHGLILTAKRTFEDRKDRYDIVYTNTGKIFEPYCSVEEVIGIINALEQVITSKVIAYEANKANL